MARPKLNAKIAYDIMVYGADRMNIADIDAFFSFFCPGLVSSDPP